jgi:HD domain
VLFPLAFAALLHDVGKRRMAGRTPERYTFYGHEHVGRRMASDICLRLRLSNEERERVEWLVERHQYLADAPQMRVSKLKGILAHPGIGDLLALHRADALASGRGTEHVDYCERKLREWTASGELNPPPVITGDDLKALGLPPGPLYKELLDAVREAQLDGRVATREQALALVRSNPSGTGGMPRIGREIGRGAEGVVYENLDQPGWVVKEFHKGGTSPFQAQNEFQNLEKARAIRPDNAVKAQAPADPRQGWLVKERVFPSNAPKDYAQQAEVLRDFQGIHDVPGNLTWGTTADNPTPRWILIE